MDFNRTDKILMELINETKDIVSFLDSIFSFLERCTDFYHENETANDPIGFTPGMAEELTFRKYKDNVLDSSPVYCDNIDSLTVAVEEVVLEDMNVNGWNQNYSEVEQIFDPNEYYNGAVFNDYCWSQTISEIEIHVHLPPTVTKAKQLNLDIASNKITITENFNPNNIILDGELYQNCKSSECVWSVIAPNKLQINLDKREEKWWTKLFKHEPNINLQNIDCNRQFDDYNDESKLMIEKFKFDQEQKTIRNEENLKKSWNLDGSPFKDLPFDPNLVHFEN